MTDKNNDEDIHNALLQSCKQELALYIVPTPIGNMDDITLRAIKTLANVDFIACEDTRVTAKLLAKLGIKKKLICYNDHSTARERKHIIDLLASGKSVALVSDAGTPLISDPGYKLIREVSEQDCKIIALPGPSSVTTALSLSGLPTDRFLFAGFLPPKKQSRNNALAELKEVKATLVFFESAKRLVDCLHDIDKTLPKRETAVLRELTKKFEEAKRGSALKLADYYTQMPAKGEIVIIVAPPSTNNSTNEDIHAQLTQALKNMSVKDAVALVADNSGISKKDVYKMALQLER